MDGQAGRRCLCPVSRVEWSVNAVSGEGSKPPSQHGVCVVSTVALLRGVDWLEADPIEAVYCVLLLCVAVTCRVSSRWTMPCSASGVFCVQQFRVLSSESVGIDEKEQTT